MASDSDSKPVERLGFDVLRLTEDGAGSREIMSRIDPAEGPFLLDTYEAQAEDLERLSAAGFCLAVLNDGKRLDTYASDVVIDSAPSASRLPYRGKSGVRLCLGSDYFPLRREFLRVRRDRRIDQTGDRLVVTFGGADTGDQTARVLDLLQILDHPPETTAILGPGYHGRAAANGLHTIERDVSNMATVLARATISVSAAGSTASELAFLGVPTILVALSRDQVPVGRAMADMGAAIYLGSSEAVADTTILDEIMTLFADQGRRARMAEAGQALVDGRGADRIAAAVLGAWSDRAPRRSSRSS